jgi:hypothetical protein
VSRPGGPDWIGLGGDFFENGEYEVQIGTLRKAMTRKHK